ncbi:rho GTPase-activating protein 45-like isoform X2 [Brienomyrus brachyistius]|uniref:rho GTPase-activating protein 45-like isoform X2 n=1 Tax=Brienomyrus brachyistius TaxID=42636 RepID=UPI0020B43147|nr:rho GTPase-activating protein 45-like isoform X2 [Brienomyrus brachyistius]
MFRKRKELTKTNSISKRTGSTGTHNSSEQPPRVNTSESSPCPAPGSSHVDASCSTGSNSPGSTLLHSRLAGCPSPGATLRRPTSLSRHASAAGFSLQATGSWGFAKGHGRVPTAQSPSLEVTEGAPIEVEDIPALLKDVARFAEAVEKLKDVVVGEEKQESRRAAAHECLGEVLRNLRQIIGTYPLLNTVETLTAAGTLISRVKGFHFESSTEVDKKEFEKAIEMIAVAFSSSVSELLMGEVDSSTLLALPPTEKSRSMENLYGAASQGTDTPLTKSDLPDAALIAEEVDIILQHSEGGVESALTYAKSISKYMKDVINYVEKRIGLEMEFSKGLQRLYHSCKHSLAQPHMPFFSIYSVALEQDQEQSSSMLHSSVSQHSQTFLQPLSHRRQEHEKRRKEIKEQWQRARRKLTDAEANLRKAKQAYLVRYEEYDKAKAVASKAEEEQSSAGSSSGKALDRKKRLEEEARNKAEEAEATYRTCIADATTQHQELEDVKVNVLRQVQELIKQSDQILRAGTIAYYQIMHVQTAPLPVHYQTLCESSKLYDPGQQYGAHVKDLQMPEEPETHYVFEPYSAPCSQSGGRARHDSFNTERQSSTETPPSSGEGAPGDSGNAKDKPKRGRGHQTHKSWPSTVSDTDSVGGDGLESPATSTGDITKMARSPSTGTMSSTEDLNEKESGVGSLEQSINGIEPEMVVPTGPFRNVGLSKAAQTHRLRKLRAPSKCRECESYVYFQGAECEECFLACHKKCLETLAIQCGHKRLQGRLQLFGRDFSQVSASSSDGVPFIITKCILEIERRALKMKGIYRVNGVKTRVEKLCQAFENGKELVELSQASPHDISNVLKLYLRQLPEPVMPFRIYNDLMGMAKESLKGEMGDGAEGVKGSELVDQGAATEPEALVLVEHLRVILLDLPGPNLATLQGIIRHLCRIAALEQENKMSPSNLGIVFGPTLMRPRPTGATVSLSSLVDYPHQARIVEALIVFYSRIFSSSSGPVRPAAGSTSERNSQDLSADSSKESVEAGEEAAGAEQQSGVPSKDLVEDLSGNSLGSSGSRERSLDSDSDLEEMAGSPRDTTKAPSLAKQSSETSTEDEHLSPRTSLDLSVHPPPLPESEPPQEAESSEQDRDASSPGP